jgi:hypothetical protein
MVAIDQENSIDKLNVENNSNQNNHHSNNENNNVSNNYAGDRHM